MRAIIITMLLTVVSLGDVYFVDNQNQVASDSNPGTVLLPFKTIQKALDVAQNPGDVIEVREGTYNEKLTLRYSGEANNRIIVKAYLYDRVIIDGTGISDDKLVEFITGTSYISFQKFEVRNATGFGIWVRGDYNQIMECEVYHNERSAIILRVGDFHEVGHCHVWGNNWNAVDLQDVNYCVVRNNFIEDNTLHAGVNFVPQIADSLFNSNVVINNQIINSTHGIYIRRHRS
jgi:hypothetical protein